MLVVSHAEDTLAESLSNNGLKIGSDYRRQVKIGQYRVDFLVGDRLIVEVDGPFHLSDERSEMDKKRQEFLEGGGYVVLRFSDDSVKHDTKSIAGFLIRASKNPDEYRTYPWRIEAVPEFIRQSFDRFP